MRMKWKRALALLLAIATLTSLCSMTALAGEVVKGNNGKEMLSGIGVSHNFRSSCNSGRNAVRPCRMHIVIKWKVWIYLMDSLQNRRCRSTAK